MDEEIENSSVLAELFERAWEPHGWTPDHHVEMGLSRDVLAFINESVRSGDRTLETGTGYSTVVFALAGATHTAISPVPWEHERLREFCAERGVSLTSVEILEGLSQVVLPAQPDDPLDFILIDGDHAFPTPFIDFYFAANRLRAGGIMLVDDTQIRTGEILCSFLESESDRWQIAKRFPTSAAFTKLTDTAFEIGGWQTQPFCADTLPQPKAPLAQRARSRVRLRSRLRGLTGGGVESDASE